MSKILYSSKVNQYPNITNTIPNIGTSYYNDSQIIVPPNTRACLVKLWGSGGYNGANGGANGGAGCGIYLTFNVTQGDILYIYINPTQSAIIRGGNGGQTNGSWGGNGGSATFLTKYSNGIHTLYALAGGGGGGGGNGITGTGSGMGGAAGYTTGSNGGNSNDSINGEGGMGGNSGTGGAGGNVGGSTGSNFNTVVPITSSTTPPTWVLTGNGGNGSNSSSSGILNGGGGGGGGGYGGGGGGGSSAINGSNGGAGGGGGSSYVYTEMVISSNAYPGSGSTPGGQANDTDYQFVLSNGYANGLGGSGFAIVYFYTNDYKNIIYNQPSLNSVDSLLSYNYSTLSIAGAPISESNQIIPNSYALNVESGASAFNGPVFYGVQNNPLYTDTKIDYSAQQGSSMIIPISPSPGISMTITLPPITQNPSVEFYFVNINPGIVIITVSDPSTEIFDNGLTSITLSNKFDRVRLKSLFDYTTQLRVWLSG